MGELEDNFITPSVVLTWIRLHIKNNQTCSKDLKLLSTDNHWVKLSYVIIDGLTSVKSTLRERFFYMKICLYALI